MHSRKPLSVYISDETLISNGWFLKVFEVTNGAVRYYNIDFSITEETKASSEVQRMK